MNLEISETSRVVILEGVDTQRGTHQANLETKKEKKKKGKEKALKRLDNPRNHYQRQQNKERLGKSRRRREKNKQTSRRRD